MSKAYIWMWRSPDGPAFFSSPDRAKAKVDELYGRQDWRSAGTRYTFEWYSGNGDHVISRELVN